ncbi:MULTISPECIES: hypothetical protein [unclassified Fibrobacter]|uniref:hypothetical protein n=1 Tax=unclassified Fibrobacter TaxID=2634177 RepID=UPI000D7AEDB8|nr:MULTISPECIES: hypothetical protein [unclassified Fibrobacter]PWJ60904.1 hypothetical protein BGX12_13311 [Fibrobacter sp. UWR4]PZW65427.1 hypothetical protein C8E88_103511 [Fibrobacter sp. UWR1]
MKNIFCLGVASLMLCACSEMSNPQIPVSEEVAPFVNVITSAVVSNPAQDPYTVENMSEALRKTALAKCHSAEDSADVSGLSFEPNYLYIRFLADGKKGAYELKQYDSSLVLFKHPLDYKPIKKPVVYKDLSLPDSIVPLFATVPVDYKFGPTRYEIIKELFLVEPDDVLDDGNAMKGLAKKASSKLDELGVSLHEVEWNSLEMTGNLAERLKSSATELNVGEKPKLAWSLFSSAKKLGGTLKFVDDYLGEQPLVGVRVTGGYSYYWREAHTDVNGHFSIPEKWSFDIDYEANFDSDEFLLEDGHSIYGEDLEIEKNNKHSDWNETFTGKEARWCAVWTAAYQYWYGNRFGLKKPRSNTAGNQSLDIEVYYKNKSDFKKAMSDAGYQYKDGVWGFYILSSSTMFDDRIMMLATDDRQSDGIYRSTIHEVAHFSLYSNQKSSLFNDEKENYRDAFTRGIEWYFTNNRYCSGDLKSTCGVSYSSAYVGIGQDLIDVNTKSADGYKSNIDKVSGFKITDVEKAFLVSKTLPEVKNYILKNLKSGVDGRSYTEDNLNMLFDYWKLK